MGVARADRPRREAVIFLVRHGKPSAAPRGRISGRQISKWVDEYNAVGLERGHPPPELTRRIVTPGAFVVASDLRRAIESAAWLAPALPVQVDVDLREGVLPGSLGIGLHLPPRVWVVIARLAWWFNCCRSAETRRATTQRAAHAAGRLFALASVHGSVVVVGHGMFNWFLARELRARGWRGPAFLPRGYWTAARYTRTSP